ncbi:hypothetical protein [Demequina lignilytica]|uniref:SpaA-like prealbumin fold domain-containing protein n=1 Tax=Demequina lignilytica TaxID=3051663 RepID=A0AB35MJ44_9MICO|nr:hypothetical protein [Demequina sp. SYSU T0a273]MDN4483854.1 hypothetical protein [Demequina sp. SYSU T0a273]
MSIRRVRRARALVAVGIAGLVTAIAVPASAAYSSVPWDVTDGIVASAGDPVSPAEGYKHMFADPEGNSKELGPINGNAYKLQAIHDTAVPVLGMTNPNPGTDMTDAWIATATVNDHLWGYFAFVIESFSTGQSAWEFMHDGAPADCAYPDLEITAANPDPSISAAEAAALIDDCNPWENRQGQITSGGVVTQPGDFFIVADYQGNTVKLGKRIWLDQGGTLVLGPYQDISAGVGKANPDNGVVEMAVDLTQEIFGVAAKCDTIGNIIPSTLTGNSDSADYKDVVLADLAGAVKISNCGSLIVDKVLDPTSAPVGSDTFAWQAKRSGDVQVRYDGTTTLSDTLVAGDFSGGKATSSEEKDLIAADDYVLSESITGDAFALKSLSCKVGTSGTPTTVLATTAQTLTFSIEVGKTTYCTITNAEQKGTLIVYKELTNDNGGTAAVSGFPFAVSGPTASTGNMFAKNLDKTDTSTVFYGVKSLDVLRGTYTVTETDIDGYTEDYSDCASVDVPAGGSASCTIYNDDQPATLIVKKEVKNAAAGAAGAVATDFLFDVSGVNASQDNGFTADPADDEKGSTTLTGLSTGDYGVTEDGATGTDPTVIVVGGITYHVTYSEDCSGTLALGGSKTCTITNEAQPAEPTGTTAQSWVLYDSLTLSGVRGDPEGDTITFKLFSDDQCSVQVGSNVTGLVDANGTAVTSTGITVTTPGIYYWTASYPENTQNNGFTTTCGDEVTQLFAKDANGDTLVTLP